MKPTARRPSSPVILDPLTPIASPPLAGFSGLKATDRAAHEEIQHRAYSIWESAGRPEHREVENWLAAEIEVLSEV